MKNRTATEVRYNIRSFNQQLGQRLAEFEAFNDALCVYTYRLYVRQQRIARKLAKSKR